MSSADDTFNTHSSEIRLTIKPGRALEKGDHRVSLYWLNINSERVSFTRFDIHIYAYMHMLVY